MVLGVQDSVHALVVRVRGIDLDAGQRGGLGVARGHRVGANVGTQLDRGERRIVVEDLSADRHHGTRKLDGLQARIRERAVGDLGQLSRVGLVVDEGDLLQRAVEEGLQADRAHRSRDRHGFHGGAREGALADGGHGVGQGDLGGRALVRHEDAVLVDLEVVGVGGAHRDGDGRGLGRAALARDGGGQRARTRVIAGGQRRLARVGVGGDRGQVGWLHAPRHRSVLQRGCQVGVHGGGLARLERHLGVGELDARVLGDGAHADLGAGRQGRLGGVGRGDRRLAGGQGANLAVVVHGGHGLVRGRPDEVGDVRVRRLVRRAQRDRLTGDDLGGLRGERQGRHRDRLEADHLAGLVLAPVPREQVGGRRVRGVRAVDEVGPLDLVVLGVGAVGLTVRTHGLLLVVEVTRGRRLGESNAGQRRVVGDVEGNDTLIALAAHRQVGDDGRLGVQGEVPGQLRVNARGSDRGCVDRQLVAARGQLLAVLVKAVEDRVVAFLAFDGLDLAGVVVEQGLAGALEGVFAHDLAGLVRVGVGHLRRVTQQAGARQDARGGLGQRGARHDEVRGVDRTHVVDFLSGEGVQGTQGHLGRGVDKGRGTGVRCARCAVVPLAVEDGRRAPGAVEAHVGDGQVGLTVGAREGHGAIDERSLGSVLIRVRGEGTLRGHGDRHGRGALGGHGHRVSGVGQVDALPRPVLGVLGEQATLDDLGERLAAQGVRVVGVGDVREGHLEGPPVRALAEVCLGAPRVVSTRDARVHGRGRGRECVHLACAHAARRVVGAVVLVDVEQRVGGTHHEGGDDRGLVRLRQASECRVVVDALSHEGGDARDLRGRHGRARHGPIGVTQDGGNDVATGGRNLRLELEIGRDTPRGEVGDRGVGRGELQARVRVGDGDGAGLAGLDGIQERILLLLRDGHGRHRVGGLDGRHIGSFDRLRVADNEGGRLGGQLSEPLDLGLVGHVRAGRAVGAAAVFEDDDLREVAGMLGDELAQGRRVTDARVDEGVGVLGDVEEARHDGVLEAARLPVDNLAIPHRQVGQRILVVNRGDRQGRAVGRGL